MTDSVPVPKEPQESFIARKLIDTDEEHPPKIIDALLANIAESTLAPTTSTAETPESETSDEYEV